MSFDELRPDRTAVYPIVQLALDSARTRLSQQDATLTALRSRTTGLLAISTVGTSAAAAVGLLNTDHAKGITFPALSGWAALILAVGTGVLVLGILWPTKGWTYGADPRRVLLDINLTPNERFPVIAESLASLADKNQKMLEKRFRLFRWAAGVLVLETAVVVVSLALGSGR